MASMNTGLKITEKTPSLFLSPTFWSSAGTLSFFLSIKLCLILMHYSMEKTAMAMVMGMDTAMDMVTVTGMETITTTVTRITAIAQNLKFTSITN